MQSYSFGYVAQGLGANLKAMFLKAVLFQVSHVVHCLLPAPSTSNCIY
jgi:hypothetical protein